MNNKEYLVTALKVRDYKGNMLDEPEVVYADIDNVGTTATGYPCWSPCWSDTYRYSNTFSSIEKAKEFFYKHQKDLIKEDRIDLNTICVKKIQYVEVEKLDVGKTKEQEELEELERKEKAELKRLLDKYGNDTDIIYSNFNGSNPYDDSGWDGE